MIAERGGGDVLDPGPLWDIDRQATLDDLVKRADAGDRAALPAVRELFDAVPGVWDAYGNLARTP
jgi:hypothetical protein